MRDVADNPGAVQPGLIQHSAIATVRRVLSR
jgi:hypothetical protein